jgi:Na+-transporting NADH:ubiquinone oxidoreductase subunit NqrF
VLSLSQSITVIGGASQKIVKIIPIPNDLSPDLSLMNFLTTNGITVASSCSGVGSCKKCVINTAILSCQITVLEFIDKNPSKRIEISYL